MAAVAEWTRRAVGVAGHRVMIFSAGRGPRTLLLVHGEHDYIVPDLAAMARDRLPNASLALFPGCSHMPFFENPERYLHTVNQFIQDTADQV